MLEDLESPPPTAVNAFLSSPSVLLDAGGKPAKTGVRYEAWGAARRGSLFVAEFAEEGWDGFKPSDKIPALTIATALMAQIRSSERFICLLTSNSSGSALHVDGLPLGSTFFELEIFQSIVLDKPTYLLVHESFDPSQIAPYLDLLEFAFPGWSSHAQNSLTKAHVLRAIDDIVRGVSAANQWQVRRRRDHGADFHQALMRSRDPFVKHESKPSIHFLNLGRQVSIGLRCNLDAIESLCKERKQLSDNPNVNNDQRLIIAWLLLRELCTVPLLNEAGEIVECDPLFLSAWNLALGDWHSTASWAALHSHIYLGTLPTLGTLGMVRDAVRVAGDQFGSSTDFPWGGYATSYYSISKRVPSSLQGYVLALARKTLLMEAGDDAKERPGSLAMLGSIALQEGKPVEAIELYERALAIHTRLENQREMGQLLCELSLARLQSGQRFKAADEAARGIALMRSIPGVERIDGFLIRAMFKSAYVQMHTLRPTSVSLYFKALELAKENGYTDQYAQWGPAGIGKKVLHTIASRFGRQ